MSEKKEPLDVISVLRMLRKDVEELETNSVDGHLVLIPKADVLDLIRDWTEYCLNPNDKVLATAE